MNCKNCGAELVPGSKFCMTCGAPIAVDEAEEAVSTTAETTPIYEEDASAAVATEAPAEESTGKADLHGIATQLVATVKPLWDKAKDLFSNKLILGGVVGGLALIVVLAIVFAILGSGNGYIQAKKSISVFALDDEGTYAVCVDKKVLSGTIDCEGGIDLMSINLDSSVAVILTADGELYGVTGTKLKLLAEDVSTYQLSVNGDYVAYTSQDADDDAATLYLCKIGNGDIQEISDEVSSSRYVISPNGKSVAYTVRTEDSSEVMYFNGKESTDITDDSSASLLGLSNSGKQIYITIQDEEDGETYLYVYNAKGEREKLETYGGEYSFNDDHTQIMFQNDEGKTYVSVKGKEANKVSSDGLELVIPRSSNTYFADGDTYPVSDLYDHVYVGDGKVWMIKKNSDKSQKLASDASYVTLDDAAEYIYYVHDGEELCVAKISHGDNASDKAEVLVDELVSQYAVTSNRKHLYYIEDGTLYGTSGKKPGKPREITDEIESFIYLGGNDVAYYLMDNDLYGCSNGKTGKKLISEIDGIVVAPNGTVFAGNEDALYATTGATKLKKILELD